MSSNLFLFLGEIGVLVLVTAFVVLVTQGTRRVPVQYAKRVVGRKVYGGTTQYLPIRVNAAGVMPIIFAQSIMFVPGTIAQLFPNNAFMQSFGALFLDFSSWGYSFIFFFVCVFFTYFYTAIQFDPAKQADMIQRQGGYIPGIRPGRATEEYLAYILSRITFPGALYLAIVTVLPSILGWFWGVPVGLSGVSIIIVAGVADRKSVV